MKKYGVILCALLFIFGCSRHPDNKRLLAKINNYEITQEEFEEEFKVSNFGRTDTLESKKEFLNNLINRKLILQDAQGKGLDKDKDFLKMIERFWEQSLLKLTLDRKNQEIIAGSTLVNDNIIEETYKKMLAEGKTDKPYHEMYNQIKWEITKLKETEKMNDWLENLHKKAEIKINYELLKTQK